MTDKVDVPEKYTEEMQRHNGELSGGYIKDIPEPHIRKWPGYHKRRRVTVEVVRWPGFPHYSAKIEEEDNPIWNPLTHAQANPTWKEIQNNEYGQQVVGWQIAWDDTEGKGREFMSENCLGRYWIAKWIELILAKHFNPETHRISDLRELGDTDTLLSEIKWGGYTRDGD